MVVLMVVVLAVAAAVSLSRRRCSKQRKNREFDTLHCFTPASVYCVCVCVCATSHFKGFHLI